MKILEKLTQEIESKSIIFLQEAQRVSDCVKRIEEKLNNDKFFFDFEMIFQDEQKDIFYLSWSNSFPTYNPYRIYYSIPTDYNRFIFYDHKPVAECDRITRTIILPYLEIFLEGLLEHINKLNKYVKPYHW